MIQIMKRNKLLSMALVFLSALQCAAQNDSTTSSFSLSRCIEYALEHNIVVRQSDLNTDISLVTTNQLRTSRFPSVEASARQNFSWNDVQSATTGNWAYEGNASTSLGVNASMNLFNGLKTTKAIEQAEIDYKAGQFDTEAQRENIALQVLGAYTQVLYSAEQVENAKRQVELTRSQLNLAAERLSIGTIARADYLQVESQFATEELTLTTARNQLATNRITLMQLMEYPINDNFTIVTPDMSSVQPPLASPEASDVYARALEVKPEIKSAALKTKAAGMEIDLAKADALPSLSLDAGLSTNYTDNVQQLNFSSQLEHNLSPTLGLTLSVPIFSRGEIKSQVATARIRSEITKLDGQTTNNQLRKNIENACLDVTASSAEFQSAGQQYNAANASYEVASERFSNGLINTVDFLVQKTSLISAESARLQARYNLIYSLKALDFYSGKSITF
ncbi:MAG TPA: hypothetical protein DEO70_01420 [Bacteroidales bacterium]|nr:MAG: hypothetical protein A2X11_03010 [Bacteroidetes bacterium GWE2_42_24]HBZ65469.1 hypothetical protein [Bacteroidales bacterium]